MIRYECAACGTPCDLDDSVRGQVVRCENCGEPGRAGEGRPRAAGRPAASPLSRLTWQAWAGLAAALFGVVVLFCSWTWVSHRPRPRRDLETAVVGMTPEEVRQELGNPDEVTGAAVRIVGIYDPSEGGWRYLRRTYDPETGKVDASAWVWFEHGRVSHVSYQP